VPDRRNEFPFHLYSALSGTNVETLLLWRNHEKRSQKYVDPRDRDTIRNNRLSHYGSGHSRQTTTDYAGTKRKLFTSKKIRKHDYSCLGDAETRTMRLHVRFLRRDGEYRDLFSFCNRTYLLGTSSHFSNRICELIRQTCLFDALCSLMKTITHCQNFIYYDPY